MTPIEALRVLTRAVDIYGNVDADDRDLSAAVWMREIMPALEVAREVCEAHQPAPEPAARSGEAREPPAYPKCIACGAPSTHQAAFADGTSYPACDAAGCQPEEAGDATTKGDES